MRAVTLPSYGDASVLTLADVPEPVAGPFEVLVDVVATAVNRADLLQRQGLYPPPPGAPPYPGLECSGRIAALGEGVEGWAVGDEVCALLSGGGYAERVAVPAGQPGEVLLVHGGSSGIGTMAVQLAARHGARVLCTVGSPDKARRAEELGAERAVRYRDEDFVEVVREVAGGADVVLDSLGASYLGRNVRALRTGGRLVVIGLMGGAKGELDLGALLTKRASVHATSLRARSEQEKAAIVAAVRADVWPAIESGAVRPVVDRVLPLEQVAQAHRVLEESGHVGKVVLSVSD